MLASSTSVSASERVRDQRGDIQNGSDPTQPCGASGNPEHNGCAERKHSKPVVRGSDLCPNRRVPAASGGVIRCLPRLSSQMLSKPLIPRHLSATHHDEESTASIAPPPLGGKPTQHVIASGKRTLALAAVYARRYQRFHLNAVLDIARESRESAPMKYRWPGKLRGFERPSATQIFAILEIGRAHV